MSEKRFPATVSAACAIVPDDRAVWLAHLTRLRGERVVVTVATPKAVRSLRANGYWWRIVVPFFQEVWSAGRVAAGLPPYDSDETHEVLVQVLVGYEDGPMPGTRVRKRTSLMDKAQFAQLVDGARALALEQYGAVIPLPGEPWEESA